jgi:hypothetical protein
MAATAAPVLATNRHVRDGEIASGVFYGLFDKMHLTEITDCLDADYSFGTEVIDAFKMIGDCSHLDTIKGFKELADAISQLPNMLSTCESIGPEVKEFADWAHIFLDIPSLETTIKANIASHKAVLSIDAGKALKYEKAEKWFAFGDEVGTMIEIVTQPIAVVESDVNADGPDPWGLTTKQYNEMLAGFAYGILDRNHATEMEACLHDGSHEAVELFDTLEALLGGHWVEAIKDLGDVATHLPGLMTDCKSIGPDVIELAQWASIFTEDPAQLESDIKRNVTRHIAGLTLDLKKARSDWKAAEFF